ncbi:hypothetical protein ACEPAH_3650 [Sanghuangporus vaninii]
MKRRPKKEEEEAKAKAARDRKSDPEDEANDEESDIERPSSDDDWSSEEEDHVSGSKGSLQALLNTGADPKLATKAKDYGLHICHLLSLAVLISDDARAEEIIDQLIRAGATCAQADERLFSVFHYLVLSGRTRLVEKIRRSDLGAVAALNVPFAGRKMVYPIVSAISRHFYSVVALLKALHELDYLLEVYLPVETALSCHSYLASLLTRLGAQVSVPLKADCEGGERHRLISNTDKPGDAKTFAEAREATKASVECLTKEDTGKSEVATCWKANKLDDEKKPSDLRRALEHFGSMKDLLGIEGAKTYGQIFWDFQDASTVAEPLKSFSEDEEKQPSRMQYQYISEYSWFKETVVPQLLDQYDTLYETCWIGDNARIQELCLPCRSNESNLRIVVTTEEE